MPTDLIYYSDVRCPLEVLTIGTAGIGLLAVWVALGKGYWAIRVFTAILLVALLLVSQVLSTRPAAAQGLIGDAQQAGAGEGRHGAGNMLHKSRSDGCCGHRLSGGVSPRGPIQTAALS